MYSVQRGYTMEAHIDRPGDPVPHHCGHVHPTEDQARFCPWKPFTLDARPVRACMIRGYVVTARGIAAPPRPKALNVGMGVGLAHPSELPLTADDRAHLYPDGGPERVAVAEFSRWSVTGHAFVKIAEGPDAGLEVALDGKPEAPRVEITYRPGSLVAELRRAA
jgi:hypothetical protein